MKKLIETALPLSEINAQTVSEKIGAVGKPGSMHMWWGRSPRYSSATAILASLVDSTDDIEELKRRSQRIIENGYSDFGSKPVIFDPFSGFGGISLAAQELSIDSIAGDLNPVAVLLTEAATRIPNLFYDNKPVNESPQKLMYSALEGLTEDIQFYGDWMYEMAQNRLAGIYPSTGVGCPEGWLWARTVKCSNPACGCEMPLASSYIINSKKGNEAWCEPVVQDRNISFVVNNGKCPSDKASNKYDNHGARFICPACGEIVADEYVKRMGNEHKIGSQLMAVIVDSESGKRYIPPTEEQISCAKVDTPEDVPQGEIPNNAKWFSPPGFGFNNYADLFSPRQLYMLTSFCDLIPKVREMVERDAISAGMSADDCSLADGGNGAKAYAEAIAVYLSFVIDKMADRNSMFCSWKSNDGSARATFGRQAIPMVWNYAEINPFMSMSGNFKSSLKNVVSAIEKLQGCSEVKVYAGAAEKADYPDNVMVCTEFPYYKAIGYAHLSDFFYIWLRRSLKSIFPELFNQIVTSKEELSTVGQYYGQNRAECEDAYRKKLDMILYKMHQCSNPDYPTLLFYEFHKADEAALKTDVGEAMTAIEHFLSSLISSGFAVNAIWPTRSSAAADNEDGIRILVVGRKTEKTSQTTRRGFINTLKRELFEKMDIAFSCGVDECDKLIVGLGCGISIFSNYKNVLNADGSNMSIRDALQLIYIEVNDYINRATVADETVEKEEM